MSTPIQIREIRNAAKKAVEVMIYDRIGRGWDEDGVTAKKFAEDLKAAGKVEEIHLRINSPGGSVFEGLAIYNTLKNHPAKVFVDIDGAALSIASVIAMAGDQVRCADNALLMIHDPYGAAAGNAADMRKMADTLDRLKESIVSVYVAKSGKPASGWAQAMTAETWYGAAEAKAAGLVDVVTAGVKAAANVGEMWESKVPSRLRAALAAQSSTARPAAAGGYTPRGLARFLPARR